MSVIYEAGQEGSGAPHSGAGISSAAADHWFVHEVLTLESALMQFLHHNWRDKSDIADLRQDVYAQVYAAALKQIPERARQFVFATARNILINRARHARVVPIEAVADLDALNVAGEAPDPERVLIARDELRRLRAALDRLPARRLEAMILAQIEGLSGREIAERLNIAECTVSEHLAKGTRLLANILYGDPADVRGPT